MLTFVLQLFPPKGNKTDGKKGSIRVSHLPSKLCFSDKYLFFGQSLGHRHHHQPTYLLPGQVYLLNIIVFRALSRHIGYVVFIEILCDSHQNEKKKDL